MANNTLPNVDETTAIEAFTNLFVTCSLRDPETRSTVSEVQFHNHTRTCNKTGSETCRFNFPRVPSLKTIMAVPVRLRFDEDQEEEKKSLMNKIRTVMTKVKSIVDDKKIMEGFEEIRKSEMNGLLQQRDIVFRAQQILEDHVLKTRILKYNVDDNGMQQKENQNIGKLMEQNLIEFLKVHNARVEELSVKEDDWMKERLLMVLNAANIKELLNVDETQSTDAQDTELLEEYHSLLGHSLKGFTVVLKRDISEVYINNYNTEWISCWNANMDISPVFDFYAVLTYVR